MYTKRGIHLNNQGNFPETRKEKQCTKFSIKQMGTDPVIRYSKILVENMVKLRLMNDYENF